MKKDLDKLDSGGFESASSLEKKIHAHYGTTQSKPVPYSEFRKDVSEDQPGHKESGKGEHEIELDCDDYSKGA